MSSVVLAYNNSAEFSISDVCDTYPVSTDCLVISDKRN